VACLTHAKDAMRMKKELRLAAGSLALLVLAGCAGSPEKPKPMTRQQQAEQLKQAVDSLFGIASQAGQGIVVMPTINLDSQTYNFYDSNDINRFTALRSGVTEWVDADDPSHVLKVGNSQQYTKVGATGSFFQTVSGRRLYQIYVVTPGHYELMGASYDLPRATRPLKSATAPKTHGVGVATLSDAMFREVESSVEWQGPRYSTQTVTDNYCTAALVDGSCVSWGQDSHQVVNQESAGGYENVHRNTQAPGLSVHERFDKPFASFDVKPGEVILVDGFYPEAPSALYKDSDCKRSDVDKMDCQLHGASLVRIFASMDNFRSATDPAKYGFTQMSAALQALQYREPQIHGTEVARQSIWGQPYQVGK